MEPILQPIQNLPPIPKVKVNTLDQMPMNILELIFSSVPNTSFKSICRTCKRFNHIVKTSNRVQRAWFLNNLEEAKAKFAHYQFHTEDKPLNKRQISKEKAAEEYLKKEIVLDENVPIEQIKMEQRHLNRARRIYKEAEWMDKNKKCYYTCVIATFVLTGCGCCCTLLCGVCIYNKIRYGICDLNVREEQPDPNPLGD